jgi:hypothetical protein
MDYSMSMWNFVALHPWWSLIYLVIICFTILVGLSGFASPKQSKAASTIEVEDRTATPVDPGRS